MGAQHSLHDLARETGVATSFTAMDGKKVSASRETIKAILAAMGYPSGSAREIADSRQYLAIQKWRRILDPVHVCWQGGHETLTLRLPAQIDEISFELNLEDGSQKWWKTNLRGLPLAGKHQSSLGTYVVRQLPTPEVPQGYHQLKASAGVLRATCLLISAPPRAFESEQHRNGWGLFAPAYALQSARSWGAGSLSDLERLASWMGNLGGSTIATLPLTATFLTGPVFEPSPYSPASRLFWNEFFIDVEKLPELSQSAKAQRFMKSRNFRNRLNSLRASHYVDYRAGMQLRREILQVLSNEFFANGSQPHAEFENYMAVTPRLADYAAFRAACEFHGKPWGAWEPRMKFGKLQDSDFDPTVRDYFMYSQWRAAQQISGVAESCKRNYAGLYLDTPVGVHPDSFDLWRESDAFSLGTSVGAPADSFFSKGQNWGFAPLHPHRCRESGYGYVRDYLRFQMGHAAVLRLDHVMALHRLYWIPHGTGTNEGAYVRYPADEFFAILNLESHRHQTVIVGENLGTVPPEVHRELKRRNFRTMYVLPFEQRPGVKRCLAAPCSKSVASINTHDMPAFAAHALGLDIADRVRLGILKPADSRKERTMRAQLIGEVRAYLSRRGLLEPANGSLPGLLKACAMFLARSDSELVLLTLEDLWGETLPQNVPGTCNPRKNWSRKMRLSLEEITASEQLADFLRTFNHARLELKTRENVR